MKIAYPYWSLKTYIESLIYLQEKFKSNKMTRWKHNKNVSKKWR